MHIFTLALLLGPTYLAVIIIFISNRNVFFQILNKSCSFFLLCKLIQSTHFSIVLQIDKFMDIKSKNTSQEEAKNLEAQNIKETTLIAFEAQYIYGKKPNADEDENEQNKKKGKKKDMEYDGGFLFPGRGQPKQVNVVEKIKQSSKPTLKQLFDDDINHSQDMLQLREFVKIMLELKHSCIVDEFIEIYEIMLKDIKNVKFEQIKAEKQRFALINKLAEKVAGFVNAQYHCKILSSYLKEDRKETINLFKVTVYCFLAEKHNFNINEFYSDAFDFQQTERKIPKKRKKTEKEDH